MLTKEPCFLTKTTEIFSTPKYGYFIFHSHKKRESFLHSKISSAFFALKESGNLFFKGNLFYILKKVPFFLYKKTGFFFNTGFHFFSKNIPDSKRISFSFADHLFSSVWSLTRLVLVEGQIETQAFGELLIIWNKNNAEST